MSTISYSTLGSRVDVLLTWMKWPAAAVSVALLPAAVIALVNLLGRIAVHPWPMFAFLAGFAGYLLIWWRYFRFSRFAWFLTLEHELTHVIFAWLTFHRVTSMRVTALRGGKVELTGRGNWLITLAPYFFPTVCVALIALLLLVPSPFSLMGDALVGIAFAFHITASLRETHPGQSDIRRSGRLFSLLFLPTANLVSCGLVLAYSHEGLGGLREFLAAVARNATWLVPW